ncbi:MAG: BCSC C-terminal domain-containing protein [Acetobacteraceae bacterium]|nr:BCSC C-terminal domain-containing protein [Acetobacteraceae bacterium]
MNFRPWLMASAAPRALLVAAALLPASTVPVLAELSAPASSEARLAVAKPVQVLLDQAEYWRSKNQLDQAQRAIDRALSIAPGNADALALRAQIQLARGDRSSAKSTLAQLREVKPDDPRVRALDQAVRLGPMEESGLAEARQLARQGRTRDAVAKYQTVFRGSAPPDNVAVEYYQTLAGTENGWQSARDGLAEQVIRNPKDSRAQLAYAELLTYREQTRAEGISRLASLSANPATAEAANKAWRQALQWLPNNTSSVPAYEAWMSRHPDDKENERRLATLRNPPQSPQSTAGNERAEGFRALSAGRLAQAEAAFDAALKVDPSDADALGGLGLVKMRQGRVSEGQRLLSQAIEADPAHRSRWEPALAGSRVGDEYKQARSLIERGQLEAADRLLHSLIAHGGDTTGALLMLANVQGRQGDVSGAESTFRTVLQRQPANGDALIGLATILNREGRSSDADELLSRAEATGSARVVGRLRAEQLRAQANATSDLAQKVALLRAAAGAQPSDPWVRLDLARALSASGDKASARQAMADMTDNPHASVDTLRAGAIFAAEDGRPQDAAALAQRLPPSARSTQMRTLEAQSQLQGEIDAATALTPAMARPRLLALAAQPDPEGTRGAAIARALARMHDPYGAREAIATAQAATPKPTPAQRIQYAGALLEAGQEAEAKQLLRSVQTAGLTAEQRDSLARLQSGLAVRSSDALNREGHVAEAYDELAPALARDPENPDLNMALGRLYQSAQQPEQAVKINEALLRRDPTNLDARRALVGAAIQAGDYSHAEELVRDAKSMAPNDPRTWMMSADLNRARGNDGRALQDLRTARALRQQQLGTDLPSREAASGSYQMVSLDPSVAPASSNPFRRGSTVALGEDQGLILPSYPAAPRVSADEMTTEIEGQIAALREQVAPKVQLGAGLRHRSGTAGFDELTEATVPLEASFSPGGYGKLRFAATPTFLSAGTPSSNPTTLRQFGTGALNAITSAPAQTANGVGLDAQYNYRWLQADLGTTPLGFQQTNIVGGVELSPAVTDNLRLRVTGERRPVTDSVLSYAGTKDPATGTAWGGVTRLRGHGQFELTAGLANFYAGGGYASLNGKNVASNSEAEFGAGGSYPVWRTKTDEVRVGLDLVYFGYDKNLRYFTLGQGGYFSPQSYFAALVPVEYRQKLDNLTWAIGGSIGYQTYNEHRSAVFPNNPALQAQLEGQALTNPDLVAFYPGKTSSGVAGGVKGEFEYNVDNSLRLGARAVYQRAGDWNEAQGLLYARYIFGGLPE